MPPALAGTLALLRVLPAVSGSMTSGLTAAVVLSSAMPLAFTIVSGLLVGSIPAAVHGGAGSPAAHHSLVLLGVAACLIVGQRVLGPLQAAIANVLGRRVDLHLQERVMRAVNRPTGIAHLEDPETLDLLRAVEGMGNERRPGEAVPALSSLLPSWAQSLGSAVILCGFHIWLGVGWVLLWPVMLYYLQNEYLKVGEATSGQAAALRQSDYYRDLALLPGPAKEVRIWGMTDWLTGRFHESWLAAMLPTWRARRPGRAILWSTALVVGGASFITLSLLAWAGVHHAIGLGALAVYLQAVAAAASFRAFDDQNMTLAYATVSVPTLQELERRLREDDASGLELPEGSPLQGIRFEKVTFRYPGGMHNVLNGLDLSIPAGRSLAIVGANGAGKTSLVKLLCRLYEPASGRITVDGIDLRDVSPRSWWRHVGAIFQDFARYHLPARDNITLGAHDRAADEEALERAARRAGALDLVRDLPNGWDTVLSRQYDGGSDLSGGQWQRIGLARALFAVEGGASVLILDEPTANLDVRAEAELYDRFLDLTAGLTTVLISHRFSTVRRADHIIVLEHGTIAEQGTHDELMELNGTYARMFRLQAERFSDDLVGARDA